MKPGPAFAFRKDLRMAAKALLAQQDQVFEDPTHRSRQRGASCHNPQRDNRRPSDHQADAQTAWHQAG